MKLVHSGIILGLAVASVAVVACSGSKIASTGSEGNTAGNTSVVNDGALGTVRGALTLSDGQTLNSVTWSVTSTDTSVDGGLYAGPSSFDASASPNSWNGTVNVQNSGTTEFTVGRLPVSKGAGDYAITLTGTTSSNFNCFGNAIFTVNAGLTTNVVISNFVCSANALAQTTGNAFITAAATIQSGCAVLTGVSATPQDIVIPIDGGTAYPVSLAASSMSSQPGIDQILYTWTNSNTTVGTLSANTGATPTFTCLTKGQASLSVTATIVTDGAASTTCTAGTNTLTNPIVITCEGACNAPNTVCWRVLYVHRD